LLDQIKSLLWRRLDIKNPRSMARTHTVPEFRMGLALVCLQPYLLDSHFYFHPKHNYKKPTVKLQV
jgi:hypothetical protein